MPSGMHARPGGVLGRDGPPRSSGVCAPASGALFGWVLTATLIVSALVLLPVTAARADIVYLYDELGRLVRVILPDGEAASYHYDAVGNIRSITRESGVAQTTTVASVSPASADRATTTTVTISGANLSGASVTTSAPGVTIQNLRTDLDSLTFDLIVSADAPLGSATVTLTGEFGTTTITFAINPQPPVIQSFTPAFGPAGATVTISGQFFDDRAPANNTVLFNGVAGIVQTVTTTSIKVTVPGDATSGPITVTHAGGSGTSAGVFITGQVAATAVTPASGTRGNTVRVAVSGTNLLGTTLSRPATTFTNLVASATEVAADAAISLSAAREGVITVSNRVTTATIGFPVEPGIPIVTSLTPIAGAVGDMVNVDGGGFDEVVTANNVVRFNGVASDIVSVAPTRIVTHVPTGATTGPVSVTTPAGTGTSAQNFTVQAAAPLRLVTTIDAPFSLPISIALRPDGLRAYVVNEDRNSVGVVDTATHTIIATISVGVFPVHAAVNPDGGRLYVVNTPTQSNADTISVVDLATNTVATTITLAHSNRRGRAFVSPDGRTVVVTHPDQNFVSIIDAPTATVAAVIATGSNPVRLAFTPDSARAYVNNNSSSGSVTVIDLATRSVLTTIPVNPQPTFAVMAPDGSRYYTIDDTTVTVIDTSSNAVVSTIPNASGTPVAAVMNPAGTRIFVAARSSSLTAGGPAVVVVDTVSNTVVTALPVPTTSSSSLSGLVLTPDGQRLVASLSQDAAAVVIDAVGNTVLGSVPLTGAGPGSSGVALADNRQVYVICQSSNTICRVDLATGTSPDAPVSRTGAFTALLTFTTDGGRGFAKAGFSQELVVAIDPATNTALPNIVIPRASNRPSPQVINLALDRVTGATLYADNSRQIVFADTASGAINGVLTIGLPSSTLLANLDGTRVYDFTGSTLRVIDAVNKTMLTSFTIGGNAAHALLSSDGSRLYVADSTNNAVKVLDPTGPSLLATIPVGTTPVRLALTAGGQKLLTLNTGSRTVSVIDLTTNTVTGSITLSGTSFGLSFAARPSGPQAFVVNRTNNRIDVLDTNLNAVTTSIPMSPAPDFLALTPDAAKLFAVQGGGIVTAIDATNATVLGSLVFAVGANGLGQPVFAPNGRVYIPRQDFDSVLVLE